MARGYKAIYRDGELVAEYQNGELIYINEEYWARKRSALSAPMIMRDIGEYRSPIDNTLITSRSAHREHLKVHDVIEVGNERVRAAPEPAVPSTREIGMEIKRRIEEVKSLPEDTYRQHVHQQRAEHEAIADLVTPSA